ESFHDVINLIWLDLAGSLARLFGLEVDDLETLFSESDPYVKEVTQLLYSFSIRPLVKKELLYLNRLQYIRGMAHKVEEQNNWEVLKD
ncbi:ATP-binding protein, partial [Enterococcus faecalis]